VRTWCPVSRETPASAKTGRALGRAEGEKATDTSGEGIAGDKAVGAELFGLHCAGCHYADRETDRIGPGLKNLLKNETLPGGRTATLANVRSQIADPVGTMPSFANLLSAEETDHLLAYLDTL
jgi:mono/diheme cytochrome c family protein